MALVVEMNVVVCLCGVGASLSTQETHSSVVNTWTENTFVCFVKTPPIAHSTSAEIFGLEKRVEVRE